MTLRRTLADRLAAQSIPEEPEHLTDPFNRGIAAALERRGIVTVPGLKSPAEEAQEVHRQRVKDVVAALTPRPPTPDPEPEPERPARLADQIRALIGNQTGDIPLNGQRLLDHVASQLDPGADSATDGQSAGSSGT